MAKQTQSQEQTTTKRIVARNAAWNCVGLSTHMLAGFLIMPFLIHTLGVATYGLWLLISSLTTYFGAMDLGVSGSVGRNVAYFRAKYDLNGINGIVNTAAAYLFGVAWVVLAATFVAMEILVHLVPDVPLERADEIDLAVFLVGLNLALTLPLSTFDGVLWAYQRFDYQNAVDIPIVILRTALAFWLMPDGGGLVTLALLVMVTSLGGALAKAGLAFWEARGLRLSWRHVSREQAKIVFSFGMWYYPLSLSRSFIGQVKIAVIGAGLGAAQVTLYNVASRLTGYAHSFLIAGTQVLTPAATAMHARDEKDQQKTLMVLGGKVSLVLALFFFSLFVCLGRPLIHLWVGPELDFAYSVLVVLAFGEIIPLSQWITYGMILGKGKHKALALASMVEFATVVTLAALLAVPFGLLAVCIASATCATLLRGVFQWFYGCRLTEVPLGYYIQQAVIPSLMIAAAPFVILWLAVQWHSPSTWIQLFAFGIVYSLIYYSVAGVAVLGPGFLFNLLKSKLLPKLGVESDAASNLRASNLTAARRDQRSNSTSVDELEIEKQAAWDGT